jgi:hypothetical protein
MPIGASDAVIDGFDLSDCSIDCGYTGSDQVAAAVRVKGKDIYIRRVQATNFGSSLTAEYGVIIGGAGASENCAIDQCIAQTPSMHVNNVGKASFFKFYASSASAIPHRFCVIRNCTGSTTAANITSQYRGIDPGMGIGTIIEGNQIANVYAGLWSLLPTSDLVVRNNYFRNVDRGLSFTVASSYQGGRIIALDNQIELTNFLADNPAGIWIGVDAGYQHITIRKNLIRDITDLSTPTLGLYGMQIRWCAEAIIENNIINNTNLTYGINYGNFTSIKSLNNQTSAGALVRAYDNNAPKFLMELEDDVQDVVIPF